ncbi:7212_t:CDS:2, partial [Paraglomus brasilianum]
IYAYTLYQQKQEQAKIEAHYQKESQKISQEVHLPPETLQQIQTEQEIIKQKELEIQQQTETLQKAVEIEEKLKKAQDSLGTSPMS